MPIAVALLADPVGAYVALVVATSSLVYGAHARRFVPLFTGFAAGSLVLLAFLHAAPHGLALAVAAAGVVLLDSEFRFPTAGAAVVLGLAALFAGSWLLLEPAADGGSIATALRALLALAGSLCVLMATHLGWRRATLP